MDTFQKAHFKLTFKIKTQNKNVKNTGDDFYAKK